MGRVFTMAFLDPATRMLCEATSHPAFCCAVYTDWPAKAFPVILEAASINMICPFLILKQVGINYSVMHMTFADFVGGLSSQQPRSGSFCGSFRIVAVFNTFFLDEFWLKKDVSFSKLVPLKRRLYEGL